MVSSEIVRYPNSSVMTDNDMTDNDATMVTVTVNTRPRTLPPETALSIVFGIKGILDRLVALI